MMPAVKHDFRESLDRELQKAGFQGDPVQGVYGILCEAIDRLEVIGQQPIKPEVVRQAIRASVLGERWRHLIIACAVGGAMIMIPAAAAGYFIGWNVGFVQSCTVSR